MQKIDAATLSRHPPQTLAPSVPTLFPSIQSPPEPIRFVNPSDLYVKQSTHMPYSDTAQETDLGNPYWGGDTSGQHTQSLFIFDQGAATFQETQPLQDDCLPQMRWDYDTEEKPYQSLQT